MAVVVEETQLTTTTQAAQDTTDGEKSVRFFVRNFNRRQFSTVSC
jgi:thiamine pyrophosphokinase